MKKAVDAIRDSYEQSRFHNDPHKAACKIQSQYRMKLARQETDWKKA